MSTSKEHMDVLEPLFVLGLDRLGWLIRALNVFHAPDRKSDNCNCSPATGGTHPMILCPSFLPPLSLTHSSSFSPFIEPCFLSASLSEWVSDSFPSFFLTSLLQLPSLSSLPSLLFFHSMSWVLCGYSAAFCCIRGDQLTMMLGKDYMLAIVIVNYEGRCVCRSQPETKQEFGESVCAHVIFHAQVLIYA